MEPIPVILIFDVGKTNKKVVIFDEQYRLVLEENIQLPETTDEDGDRCENINLLSDWILNSFWKISANPEYEIRAVSFSAYGASFVHLNDYYKPVSPLYNYLKPFPEHLKKKFYEEYGGETNVSKQTASPVLGNLNSGMQLYYLKYEKPDTYAQIKYSLHLPQFLSYLISAGVYSDITSLGCHTNLWDFSQWNYHEWVFKEGIDMKLAPIYNGDDVVHVSYGTKNVPIGVGLHDSSAALIPYLQNFKEPFVLISTGTWCISLNPFNQSPLTEEELSKDCLFYITYEGNPVKASRLFAGYEHEEQTKRLAAHYGMPADYYRTVEYDPAVIAGIRKKEQPQDGRDEAGMLQKSQFGSRDLAQINTYEEAYHQLIFDLITQQLASTKLILEGANVTKIFVDGGFSKNPIYMRLLAASFPDIEVYAASVALATAMGAALAIHKHWNTRALPDDIIDLKFYAVPHDVQV